MNTYFRQIEPKYMGRQQNYKVVIRYWSLVSRCHLSDRLTLLMYTRIDKCGERLPKMNAIPLEIPQVGPEWLARRNEGIGSSDAASILGRIPEPRPMTSSIARPV